jgi:hypothetical protein
MCAIQSCTQVLIAWSTSRLVVAFRGTAKKANVLSDAKVTPQGPLLGQYLCFP